jgi:hypothetical protein
VIPQAIGGLLEIIHRLVDVVFRSAAVDPAAIDRLLETAAEGRNALVHATQQIAYLLITDPTGSLLRQGHTDTRERDHSRQGDNVTSSRHNGLASIHYPFTQGRALENAHR